MGVETGVFSTVCCLFDDIGLEGVELVFITWLSTVTGVFDDNS